MLCLVAPGLGSPCCGSSRVRGLNKTAQDLWNSAGLKISIHAYVLFDPGHFDQYVKSDQADYLVCNQGSLVGLWMQDHKSVYNGYDLRHAG